MNTPPVAKKRILFVDDEPMVLDGLRALLRPRHDRWDMRFVNSGAEALAELGKEAFDVIVTDMRMPQMDGNALLRKVQERYPAVVRIVLSGYSEVEVALRTVPVAHQFLIKPCDADLLERVVERACALQAMIQDDGVRRYVGRLQHLPTLPAVYLRMRDVIADENVSLEAVARVVEDDPAMSAKVLQLVNSPFVGLGREVTSLQLAISYLGMSMLKDLTLATQVFRPGRASAPVAESLAQLQRHSLLVAALARRMAADDKRLAEEAFIAGLLHDIGKFVLISEQPVAYTSVLRRAQAQGRDVMEVERELLGVTHAQVGGYLLGIWGLPNAVAEAAAAHHDPALLPASGRLDALALTYIADVLLHEQEARSNPGTIFAPLDEGFVRSVGAEERLPQWREIAASLADPAAEAEGRRAA